MSPGRIIILLCLLLLPHLPAKSSEMHRAMPQSGEWSTLSTIHFDIYFPSGLEDRALRTAAICESGYVLVANHLGHEMKSVIPVIVAPSSGDPRECSFIHPASTGPGCCPGEYLPCAIHAPFNGSYAEYRRRVTHELVHSFQLSILSHGGMILPKLSALRLPLWIAEGMADYIAEGPCVILRNDMDDPATEECSTDIRNLTNNGPENRGRYGNAGRAFCFFLEKRYGRSVFGEMIRDFRDLGFLDDVIMAATGKDVEAIDAEWARFMKDDARTSRKSAGTHPASASLAREGTARIDLVPAVSPDGNRIAYLSDRDCLPVITVLGIDSARAGSGSVPRTLIDGSCFPDFGGVNATGNGIAWSNDARTILFAGVSGNSQCLIFADALTGRIRSKVILPFTTIGYPSTSRDGRYAVFTGIATNSEDIYLCSIPDGTITRITDDAFSDRYPVFTPDGKSVVFASTWNREGNIYSDTYSLFMVDLKSSARVHLAGEGGASRIQPDISADGKKMLYGAGEGGGYAVWLYEFDTGKNVRLTGRLGVMPHPRWLPGGKQFVYTVRRNGVFELRAREVVGGDGAGDTAPAAYTQQAEDPVSYVSPAGYLFSRYNDSISPEHLVIGGDGTTRGSLAYIRLSMADTLVRHRLVVTSNYMRESNRDDVNAGLSYSYAREGWALGVSAFRQASPLPAASLGFANGPLLHPRPGICPKDSALYGGAISASYPFCRFFTFSFRAEAGGYRKRFRDFEMRSDYTAGTGKLSALLEYDALRRGAMVPLSGLSGRIQADQVIDFNRGRALTGATIDMHYYANPARQCVIALRGAGGALFGGTAEDIDYHIGGYGTLRGFDLLGVSGKNMFLVNAELWLTPGDWRSFGTPLSGAAGNIGFVLFMDAGAAWDGKFSMLDKSGRFDDFKIDFGVGLRAAISPVLIFKLDFAWPFDRKSLKENVMSFSADFEY